MADPDGQRSDPGLGLSPPAPRGREQPSTADLFALGASLIWLVVAGLFFLLLPGGEGGTLTFVMTLIAIFMPVAMIWVAVAAGRSARIMREESRRLQAAIDGMRATYLADRNARAMGIGGAQSSTVERKLTEIAQVAKATEAALATFTTSRAAEAPRAARPLMAGRQPAVEDQPSLALLADDPSQPPLMRRDLIRALNFPEDEKDAAGFTAMRRAMKDRQAKALIQASQDVLTLLSQEGIYMDDLTPDRARPEIWRRFAQGERGRSIAPLGGIHDRSSLALVAGRMREDTIFRDAGHHFLRLFDKTLVAFEPEASDEDIIALSDTRTARAFMLLGRVAGTFD
jgi:hypothetical protein